MKTKIVALLASFALQGCYNHLGTTKYGFTVLYPEDAPPGYTIEEINRHTDRILDVYQARLHQAGFSRQATIEFIQGYTLIIRPEKEWFEETVVQWNEDGNKGTEKGRTVRGTTNCGTRIIQINTREEGIKYSSFAHELVHLAQNCNSPKPVDNDNDPDHSNWTRDGIYDAINRTKWLPQYDGYK